ncbi:hypothetical protein KML24007_04130 [Alistipes indistinctus]|uniref:ComEC/Rec2 family competence protein n=1 Tax=Alistipes indistinctus TaxID=626932 RepID=UPI0036F28BCF
MSRKAEVIVWDVQHGLAIYIKSPNGRHIVIDLGTGDYSGNNASFSPLRHLYANYGVRQIDTLIITHPHLDHIDDINLADSLSPKSLTCSRAISEELIMDGVLEKDKPKYRRFIDMRDRYSNDIPNDSPEALTNPDNWGGMSISTFAPLSYDGANINNYGIITVIEYAGVTIVIPGDNEEGNLADFMKRPIFKSVIKDAHILIAPHHGRKSGFNTDFANHINPYLTIVSDGRHCDTSANHRYSAVSRGWLVHRRNGSPATTRKCLTTNSDGEVYIQFGYNDDDSRYLEVKI